MHTRCISGCPVGPAVSAAYVLVYGCITSKLGWDTNGCGFPVLKHNELIMKVVFGRSIEVGAPCDTNILEFPWMRKNERKLAYLHTKRRQRG